MILKSFVYRIRREERTVLIVAPTYDLPWFPWNLLHTDRVSDCIVDIPDERDELNDPEGL